MNSVWKLEKLSNSKRTINLDIFFVSLERFVTNGKDFLQPEKIFCNHLWFSRKRRENNNMCVMIVANVEMIVTNVEMIVANVEMIVANMEMIVANVR
jgi:hypothetical protein